jgi:HAD superfamily hydrolase (TIGR01509 family)
MKEKLKNIIFDFDGVIADVWNMSYKLFAKMDYDKKITTQKFKDYHNGNVFEKPNLNFDPDFYFAKYYQKISKKYVVRAVKYIKKLEKNDFTLFIISSNTEKGIKKALREAEILNSFDAILGVETEKSKIKKFKMIEEKFGVNKENAIFITDTLGDILESNKIEYKVIAETFGYHNRETLKKGNPYKIVDSWEEIVNEIMKLR